MGFPETVTPYVGSAYLSVMRLIMGTVATAVLALSMTGCGGDDDKPEGKGEQGGSAEYCAQLEEFNEATAAEQETDLAAAKKRARANATAAADLAKAAPDEVVDDWDTVASAYQKSLAAMGTMRNVDPKNPPAGMTEDDAIMKNLQELMKALGPMAKTEAPMKRIAKHAKAECDVEIDVG